VEVAGSPMAIFVDDKGVIYRFKDYEKTVSSSRNLTAGGSSFRSDSGCQTGFDTTNQKGD
jgi:hypothetical protein